MKFGGESPCTPQSAVNRRMSLLVMSALAPRLDIEDIPMTLDSLISILQLTPRDRSLRQRLFVAAYMGDVGFFKRLAKDEGENACKQCCQALLYETYSVGEFVFRQDDLGDRFYIVLEGSCGVLIETDRSIQEVRTYGPGDSFGELALLQNQPRAASIQCKTLCHFAVLRREDHEKTLHRLQKRKLDEKVEFLLGQPMFKSWSKGAMTKLSYYFNERNYTWKQVVYRAGDPANDVFFIKKGEFRLLKDLPVPNTLALTSLKLSKHRIFTNPADKSKSKKQFEIASLTHGEVVGLDEVFDSVPRACTCVCYSGDAETLFISKEDLFRRVKNEEKIAQVKSLLSMRDKLRSQRLEKRERMNQELMEKEAPEKTQTRRTELQSPARYLTFDKFLSIIENSSGASPYSHRPTTKVLRSSNTWDNILRKTLTSRKSTRKPKPALVVNIHTHSAKLLDRQVLFQHSSVSMTSRSTIPTPVRSATLVTPLMFSSELSMSGSLGLISRKEWKMKQSRHSLFRPMRSSRA